MNRRAFLEAPGLALASAAFAPSQRQPPRHEFDYVDWTWDRWREITRETRPAVTSDQVGRAELMELANPAPSQGSWPIAVRASVASSRSSSVRHHRSGRRSCRGWWTNPGQVRSSGERSPTSSSRTSGPRPICCCPRISRGPAPAVLCPHQTTHAARNEPAGLAADPELHTALRLAERGSGAPRTTPCASAIGAPRRAVTTGTPSRSTATGPGSRCSAEIWDLSRESTTSTLDIVDARRIGSISHSHDDITTLWGMRVRRSRSRGRQQLRLRRLPPGRQHVPIVARHTTSATPRLYVSSRYLAIERTVRSDSEVIQVPFDERMTLAMIAPRPVLLSTSDDDACFRTAAGACGDRWRASRRSMRRSGLATDSTRTFSTAVTAPATCCVSCLRLAGPVAQRQ